MDLNAQRETERITRDMRQFGESLIDKGLFEIDTDTGAIRWINSFVSHESGYQLSQVQSMSIYDLVPTQFHDNINTFISDLKENRQKHFIFPEKTSEGKILWWFIIKTENKAPISWFQGETIVETNDKGVIFAFMKLQIKTLNFINIESNKIEDLDGWVQDEIKRIDQNYGSIVSDISELKTQMFHVKTAATNAAQESINTRDRVDKMEIILKNTVNEIKDEISAHTQEILSLIGADQLHDKRIEAFENHVKKTTEIATKMITQQADKAGRGLSKRVTIPVSLIALVATIIQYLIQNWQAIINR